MNVLLVAGTGLLGREIANAMVGAGHSVTVLSNDAEPALAGVQRYNCVLADRNDATEMARALEQTGLRTWDLVVDVASYHAKHASILLSLLGNACSQLIVISTTFVYSPNAPLPLKEDSPLGTPEELGGYASNKALMEKVWIDAWRSAHFPVTILRLPHTLAPGCMLGAVPLHNRDPHLVARLRSGRPVFLADGGRQLFQVVSGTDVGSAIVRLAGKERALGNIYNCASPEIHTGRSYFETIAELLGLPLQIRNVPAEPIAKSGWGWELSLFSRIYDLSVLERELDWLPNTSLREALKPCLTSNLHGGTSENGQMPDPLEALDRELHTTSETACRLLRMIASTRDSTIIDRRMNLDPRPECLR
jgi:nucleoside-diphosphate-sugar epimerase